MIIQHDHRSSNHIVSTYAGHTQEVCGLKWNKMDMSTKIKQGLDCIDIENLPLDNSYNPTFGNGGEVVTAYIIDTGILVLHDKFEDRATQELNSAGGANEDCKDRSSSSQNTNVALDGATVTSLHSFCQDIQA